MQYTVETPSRTPKSMCASTDAVRAAARRRGESGRPAGVVDSASYQAMLCDLGLAPDPRLCVPAVCRW